ncbi:hypothetical protein PISMIDRAFT_100267 [Pisolithus microcarpus 441]|uniref:F-box domain-containing protein n=1 Tax=Pisolithus microcarpus 441 TaxID=765257 RepID=A0A0C9Z3B0_9AGAM|nr:hypothetical protein PISMIDRAFT_100267 [Pisolithus microcarpus 441]
MAHIIDLPLELLEHILYMLDPLDVSRVAQASRLFRRIVYLTPDYQRFWRGLYLAEPLDDPRDIVTYLGSPRLRAISAELCDIDWQGELQRIIRARTIVRNPHLCRKGEWTEVLRTLLDLATTLPPVPFAESECTSRNVAWVLRLLQDGAFLDIESMTDDQDDQAKSQMLARLHTWVGLTRRDVTRPEARFASRAYVYNLRNFGYQNAFAPLMLDGTMRVDWKCMRALAHAYGMKWIEMEKEEAGDYSDHTMDMDTNNEQYSCPLSLPFCQSVIPPGMNLDMESDWAGVEGLWYVGYSFFDHREFLSKVFTPPHCPPCAQNGPLDTSVFEGDNVPEMHASVTMYFRVIGIEPDPDHPTRPRINYAGEHDSEFSVIGYVKLTPDDQIRWHYVGGNGDQPVWNCDGIGLGGVRSQAGVLGVWSTVFHDSEDPVGPLWMRRQQFIVD